MRALIPLLAASLLTLAFSLSSPDAPVRAAAAAGEPLSPPRLACGRPRTLHLRRFEDGSALLRCGGRTLARVSVPG